jgi:hypothetical protein
MAFVKLDAGILNSTIWVLRPDLELFITALLMATPVQLEQPTPTLKIRVLEADSFVIPPGWYGFVEAAGPGIINRAHVALETGLQALERLASPEPESRSQEFEGRRMVRINGGYIVLNFMRYRDKDHTAAERQRRLRARRKGTQETPLPSRDSNAVTRDITPPSRDVTQSEDRGQRTDAEIIAPQSKKRAEPTGVTVIPLLLSTDEFAVAWRDWLQHRKEIKHPIAAGSQTERGQLKQLEEWGVERAIAAIRFTIFKGWQGLKEPDERESRESAGVIGKRSSMAG